MKQNYWISLLWHLHLNYEVQACSQYDQFRSTTPAPTVVSVTLIWFHKLSLKFKKWLSALMFCDLKVALDNEVNPSVLCALSGFLVPPSPPHPHFSVNGW